MPDKYIVKDQETGKEYQRGGNDILSSYKHNGALCWQYDFGRNIPLNVARFLLTDFDTAATNPFEQMADAAAKVREMFIAAVVCLAWSETDNEAATADIPLDDFGCCEATLEEESRLLLLTECQHFLNTCQQYGVCFGKADLAQVGHDFILTRNGHGAGFWDREDLYGRDYLFLSFMAGQYATIHGCRTDGADWYIDGLTGLHPALKRKGGVTNMDS